MTKSWRSVTCRFGAALVVCVLLGLIAYGYVRVRLIYQFQYELAQFKVEMLELDKRHTSEMALMTGRVDYLESVLFGDVLTRLREKQPAPQNRIELWQVTRDKQLRERIRQLELWRWRSEGELPK